MTWPDLYCAADIGKVIAHLKSEGWNFENRSGEMVTAVCTCGSQHRFTFTLWPRLPEVVWHDVDMAAAQTCMDRPSR